VVLVVGAGTEVGKTWVTARLLATLRAQGVAAAARKLAQSYAPDADPATTDAAVLGEAGGEPPETVCPPHRWYPALMAPPMAAEALGRPGFSVADLIDELRWPQSPEASTVGLVETAGGVRSPQADDGDVRDVVSMLDPDGIVVVAHAGLGAINEVLLAVDALSARSPGHRDVPLRVVLNRFEPDSELHRRNRDWLEARAGLPTSVMPGGEGQLGAWVLGLRPPGVP
jgi:dethiobiotin synthetase